VSRGAWLDAVRANPLGAMHTPSARSAVGHLSTTKLPNAGGAGLRARPETSCFNGAKSPSHSIQRDWSHIRDQKTSQPEHFVRLVETLEADVTDMSPAMTAKKRSAQVARSLRAAAHDPVPPTSPTFHPATSLLVEGFIVFDQTRGTNDEIRLNRLLMMNGFINQLLTIDEGPGWTGRLVVGVVEGPDPQQGSSALPDEVVAN